jgi:hypothetical protein
MRKILILTMAFLLPVFALEMRADEKEQIKKIPLKMDSNKDLCRSLVDEPIVSVYYAMFTSIQTTVTDDLGEVDLTVTNLMTGESWWTTFDSGETSQSLLPISGSPGYYEIEYITESGDVYVGEFLIE